MSNYSDKTKKCFSCANQISVLEEFPGGICVECYAIEFDKQAPPSDDDITKMFRNLAKGAK